MSESLLLGFKRRGQGLKSDPWRWSGRCLIEDVWGTLVATVGADDIEQAIIGTLSVKDASEALVRVLVPGWRRFLPAPMIRAKVVEHGEDVPRIACKMRGNVWSLAELLGRVVPARHLVTIEAWVPAGLEERSTLEQKQARTLRATAELEAFLKRSPIRTTWGLSELALAVLGESDREALRFLRPIAQGHVARGHFSVVLCGKRRLYTLTKVPD